MEVKTIVSIDPGVSNGIVVVKFDTVCISLEKALILKKIEREEKQLFYALSVLEDEIKMSNIVLYEGFRNNSLDKYGKTTLETIGIIKYLAHNNNIKIIEQMPSVRTGYLKLAKDFLKVHGVKNMHHVSDAMAHALRYIHKEAGINVQAII